jgi:hypothetical protein
MAKKLPNWRIVSEGKHKYLVDDSGNKMYWLLDDGYLSSVDGREHKKGFLQDYNKDWYEAHWYKEVVAYVKK